MSSNLLTLSKDTLFKVLGCGKILSTSEINRNQGLPHCFIAYSYCGNAEAIVDGEKITLLNNCVLVLPKNIPFLLKANSESRIIWVEFLCEDNVTVNKDIIYNVPASLSNCINGILTEYGKNMLESEWLVECYITELAVNIKRLQLTKKHNISEQCKNYIDEHFNEQISNELLSSIFNISVNHLIFKFNKEYGIPPIKYLNKVRIDKAKKLLSAGVKPSEIAVKVGYKNIFYFSRVFKKFTGFSPTEFSK